MISQRTTAARAAVLTNGASDERAHLIEQVLERRQAIATPSGALASWHGSGSTGRIPDDTYIVRDATTETTVDWSMPNAHAMTPETFDRLFTIAAAAIDRLPLHAHRRAIADASLAVDVHVRTTSPLHLLFADSLLLPPLPGAADRITILVVPEPLAEPEAFRGVLRDVSGTVSGQVIAMDIGRRTAVIHGTSYLGALKKTVFTMLNHLLPDRGVLPLHCSAAQDRSGGTHLFLGLSGTGKTTLSADPDLRCIGDDEHVWTCDGIANIEGGCYAKLARLRREQEPNVFDAVFAPRPLPHNGVIVENAFTLPDGGVNLDDLRLTENSRAAYPQSYLKGAVLPAVGAHPRTLVFLTADATGVLPPVARLSHEQALLWYALGYTSKLAGTEIGVQTPKATFSRLFGAPFMTHATATYLALLDERLRAHRPAVYLVNTGWSGGGYGIGQRMSIATSRSIVHAALSGALASAPMRIDEHFGFAVPRSCPGVEPTCLDPRSCWSDGAAYDNAARLLVAGMQTALAKHKDLPADVRAACPAG